MKNYVKINFAVTNPNKSPLVLVLQALQMKPIVTFGNVS